MNSYRETLCNADEKGFRPMSPYCNANFTLASQRVGNMKIVTHETPISSSRPVLVDPFRPPSESRAHDYESDFSYSALIAMGRNDEPMASDDLRDYHHQKSVERMMISVLTTL